MGWEIGHLGLADPKGMESPWDAWTWGLPGMGVPDMSLVRILSLVDPGNIGTYWDRGLC